MKRVKEITRTIKFDTMKDGDVFWGIYSQLQNFALIGRRPVYAIEKLKFDHRSLDLENGVYHLTVYDRHRLGTAAPSLFLADLYPYENSETSIEFQKRLVKIFSQNNKLRRQYEKEMKECLKNL